MEAGAQQKPSLEQDTPTKEIPIPSSDLASLLDDERFLLLVFEYLVEHGLQNCRLVCRRWREVCKQFPVKLRDVGTWGLKAMDSFPNATSASARCCRTVPVVELFERLSSLDSLISLTLRFSNPYYDGSVPPCFQSMVQLTYLSIYNGISRLPENLVASVKHLTNLTRLYLHVPPPKLELEPFVELQKIQDLDLNSFTLFNKNEAIMFPSLTNLTRLSFNEFPADEVSLLIPNFTQVTIFSYLGSQMLTG